LIDARHSARLLYLDSENTMSTPFIGEIRMFGFGRTPNGWQACDGSLLAISEYDVLFNLIGTTYGGDGQTTFAVPDLRGRLPIHQGQGPGLSPYVIGQAAGTETVTLITTQIPAHTHSVQATSATATSSMPGNAVMLGAISGDTMYATDITGLTGIPAAAQSVSVAGGSQPHENTMPTLTVQYCIAWAGIYPQQN
jgi:microcystin-dependent protein